MKPFLLSSVLVAAVFGAVGGAAISSYLSSPAVVAHAQGKSQFAPGQQSADPSAVGTWFGVARPCPATGDDAGHAAFCQAICGACASTPGTLPPEVPMMPTIHSDGTVTVNDADPATRDFRLALLDRFRAAVHKVADFSRIEG